MSIERETIVDQPVHRETVVTGGGGSGGLIAGIVVAVAAVLLLLWLLNGGITSDGNAVNVDLPQVTVTE